MKSNRCTKLQQAVILIGALGLSAQAIGASIGLGLARTNEFSGSADFAFIPTAAFELETRIGIFKNNQVGVQLDLIKSTSVDTGPILRLKPGRGDNVSDDAVAALPEIEAAGELGWFVGSGFRLDSLGITSNMIVIGDLTLVTDLTDAHEGTTLKASAGLVMPVSDTLRFIPSVTLNYADDNYTNTYYGVENATSELAAFNAKGGIESTQIALVGIKKIDKHWSVTGVGGYTTLQGDAAKSPITERGSDTQIFTGVTVNYTF